MYSKQYIILFLELIFFMRASYRFKTAKKLKINFDKSPKQSSWKNNI